MPPKTNPLTRGKKQKALAHLQRNQLDAAIPLLDQVCRTDPRDAEAAFKRDFEGVRTTEDAERAAAASMERRLRT